MLKRLFALLLISAVMLSVPSVFCDGFDEMDDPDDSDWLDDEGLWEDWEEEPTPEPTPEPTIPPEDPELNIKMAQNISQLSGYRDRGSVPFGKDYTIFRSEDGKTCITEYYTGTEMNLVVPAEMNGSTLLAIGDHTFEHSMIQSVTLPDTLLEIGKQAFFQCVNLKGITIPEGVVSIGDQCFGACMALESLELPDSLESVGEMAFLYCIALKEVEFGGNIRYIGPSAFHSCQGLEKVVLPSRSVQVDPSAFLNCPETLEIVYRDEM